jgi:hypothetical protein
MPASLPRLELYDLSTDPAEASDISERHPQIVTRMHEQIRSFGKLGRPGIGAYAEGRDGFRAPRDWILEN